MRLIPNLLLSASLVIVCKAEEKAKAEIRSVDTDKRLSNLDVLPNIRGYRIPATLNNGELCDFAFDAAPKVISACENTLVFSLKHKTFDNRKHDFVYTITFNVEYASGGEDIITAKTLGFLSERMQLMNYRDIMGEIKARGFLISKDDYRKMMNAKSIKFAVNIDGSHLSGNISSRGIAELKKHSQALLKKECYEEDVAEKLKKQAYKIISQGKSQSIKVIPMV